MADTTATIDPRTGVLTLINVYDVEPAKQALLADALRDMTDRSIRLQPGFISVCIHVSVDGEKVVNYAQWESKEHFEGFMKKPETREQLGQFANLALKVSPSLYTVRSVLSQ